MLTAALAVLAISSSAAFSAEAAVTATSVTAAAEAAPLPVGVSPEPPTTNPDAVVNDPATPVVEAGVPTAGVPVTSPDPPADVTPPVLQPVTPIVPVTPTAPDAGNGSGATPVAIPAQSGPDAAPTPAPGAPEPSTTPGTAPDPQVASPLPPVTAVPVAARGADTPPVVKEPTAKPVELPAAVKPEPVDLTPTLQAFASRQVTTPVPVALPGAGVPVPIQATTATTLNPPAIEDEGTTALVDVKAFDVELVQASGSDRSGSILELLAGYVFPGAANSNNGAILLLFSVALLLAVVTPRIPRLHLTTLVAQRGAGCPGYNPVALRPG